MFYILWRYQIYPDKKAAFEKLYGPTGQWVKLFKKADGYIKTELLKSTEELNAYLTIDAWQSQDQYEQFLNDYKKEFAVIDQAGEKLTVSETKIGWFKTF